MAWILLLMTMVTALACGRKGAPVPDYSHDEFAFGSLSASLAADGAVTIHGTLTGAFQNMEYMILEMQPVTDELCTGCPFLAQDQHRIDARDAWESENGSSFLFVYRPVFTGSSYRWRMKAHNMYSGLPDVVSDIQIVGEDILMGDNIAVPAVGE
jgi:hypothetical protein